MTAGLRETLSALMLVPGLSGHEDRDLPAVLGNESHHATAPEEKYRVIPYAEQCLDTGLGSAEAVAAAGAVEANGCSLPLRTANGAGEGQPVIYGIRPEHLEPAEEGFPARVSVVEPTGAETLVFLRFGEAEIVAAVRDRHHFETGQTVTLRPRPDKAHVFDGASGERL